MKTRNFFLRLRIAYRILFGKYKHFFVISVESKDLVKILNDDIFYANLDHIGLKGFLITKIIKALSESKRETDVMLERLSYEHDFEEWKKRKK